MNRYLIVADDFTGANDTGVQLKRRGVPTDVVFSTELINNENSYVLDTESRSLSPEEAFNKVSGLVKDIDLSVFKYIMKKVDSTLRGNIAHEVKAVDNCCKSELIIFAPALPDLNRTTLEGIHLLNGTPITQTELARDPKNPVMEDNLQAILSKVFTESVTHINLNSVRETKSICLKVEYIPSMLLPTQT